MITLFACSALLQGPVLPPYLRQETVPVFATSYNPPSTVVGSIFYGASGDTCVAYQLPSLKKLWSVKLPKGVYPGHLSVGAGTVLMNNSGIGQAKSGSLIALNARTGQIVWRMPTQGEGSALAVGGDTLFTALKPHSISAISLRSRKPFWTTKLPSPTMSSEGTLDSVSCFGSVLAVNCDSTTYGIDAKTGKVLWREPKSYMFRRGFAATSEVVWVAANEGSIARSLRTGKELWRSATIGYSEFGASVSGRLVGLDDGALTGVDPESGKVVWTHKLGDDQTSGGNQYGAIVGGYVFARGISGSIICDATGKVVWEGKDKEALPQPIWTDGLSIVCFDGLRLLRYVHGQEAAQPSTPAGRQSLASQMVARFNQLDEADKARLRELKDDAFEPLLKAFIVTCAAYDNVGKKGDSYPLYSKYHDLGELLDAVTTASRTPDLIAALELEKPKSSARPQLLTLMAKVGDPAVVTPYFLQDLQRERTPGWEMYESTSYVARQYIIASKDPRAVAYVLRQLEDPKGDPVVKQEAYWHLAGTGGEAGVRAVLAERHSRTLLRPLNQRALEGFLGAGEYGKKQVVLAEKKDAKGQTWGLVESGVLGSAGDLWLVKRSGGKLTDAWFVGVTTLGVSAWAKPAPKEPLFAGKTAKQLKAGSWFASMVGNAILTKDTDRDGLTDIAEKRLGTDPKVADSDSDGDGDAVDPWPNVAPRKLSDAEQILAAAFEARYHFESSEGPGIFFAVDGMTPFEMVGRRGPTVWMPEKNRLRWSLPLEQCYDQGVAFIQFDVGGKEEEGKPWEERVIHWNSDKTEATVGISTYYGGLNGTGYEAQVRKFGDHWIVVAMHMVYVS